MILWLKKISKLSVSHLLARGPRMIVILEEEGKNSHLVEECLCYRTVFAYLWKFEEHFKDRGRGGGEGEREGEGGGEVHL